jgi:hypothetical protein
VKSIDNQESLTGTSGWLLLFVILKLLSPIFFLVPVLLASRLRHSQRLGLIHPDLMQPGIHPSANHALNAIVVPPALHLIFLIVTLTSLLIVLSGILAAIGIILRHRWALQAVVLNLVLSTFSALMPLVQPGHHSPAIIYRQTLDLAIILLWFAYFYRSERVHNTLGHNLFQPPHPGDN